MSRRRIATAAAVGVVALASIAAASSTALATTVQPANKHEHGHNTLSYTVATPVVDKIKGGPWTLSQGDASVGGSTITVDGVTYPNAAVDPSGTGAVPAQSGVTGTPSPLTGYCSVSNGANPSSGTVLRQPKHTTLAMQPYYFPFVTSSDGGKTLTGYFDYRPKDTDEAVVSAISHRPRQDLDLHRRGAGAEPRPVRGRQHRRRRPGPRLRDDRARLRRQRPGRQRQVGADPLHPEPSERRRARHPPDRPQAHPQG